MRTTRPSRSVYSCTERGEFLCLIDSGQGRSITNAAEAVITELAAAGHDLGQKRVLYRDTMGFWDELVVKHGQFSHFAPIHERDLESAIIKARTGGPAEAADLSAALFGTGADAPKQSPDLQKDGSEHDRGGRRR